MPIRPPTPGWFTKVNFIVGWWFQDCDVPLTLYVQFARAPSDEAVLLLIGLDLKDIVKEFFRPAGLRSGRHGRKGSKGKRPNINLLDPSEMFAKNTPGYTEYRGRPFGSPTFWVYEITDVIDRVTWTFAVVDALTDIGYGTLIGILAPEEGKELRCPKIGRMLRHTYFQIILNTHGGYAPFPLEHIDYVNAIDTPNGYVATVLNDGRYAATLEVEAKQTTPGNADIAIGIYDYVAGKNLNESPTQNNTYPATVTLALDAMFTGPGTIGASIMTNTPGHPGPGGQHFEITKAKWLILEIGHIPYIS